MSVDPAAMTTPYASKVGDKSATSVSYSSDIAASWGSQDTASTAKGKGSVAGSLYYTASDTSSRIASGSVYDAVSLSDSDEDFQIEVASTSRLMPLPQTLLYSEAICCPRTQYL